MMEEKSNQVPFKRTEIVLRDLENILKKELGASLIVDSFTTSNLVASGENYGSTILRVDAEVRREGQDSESEKLFLVAKMIPPTEFQKMIFDTSFTFGKEIYVFTDIVPAYKALEVESGIPQTEVSDPLPKFYGSRLTLKEGNSEVDEDAAILMENLKVRNYYCGDRKIGFDMPHAKLVVESIACFHADGIAVKLKKPHLFNEFKTRAKPLVVAEQAMAIMVQFLIKAVNQIPVLLPHVQRIEAAISRYSKGQELYSIQPPTEPWGTIIHTDLWVNNVMFRDDEFGNPVDVKFVDFQASGYQNPLQDLVFFLMTCLEEQLRFGHIDDLIDLYYHTFVSQLARLKCDVSSFPRDSFNEQLIKAAKLEYLHCVFMIRVLMFDAENENENVNDPEQNMFECESTDVYRERLTELSLKFIKENWI